MAVVSISRIQIRRGKEQSGSGLPQLASGELGWAIDTQNLYIGNGSVSEGAPYVGNTRILTESDNLFDLPNVYTYRDGSSIAGTVSRDLQDRLDDRVSVRAFGVSGNGTDITTELQTAIYQLFLNTNPQDKAVLHMEPGEYVISSTVFIPKNTKIVGAGIGKTTIKLNGSFIGFFTVNDNTTATTPQWSIANDSDTHLQPTGIHISGITFENMTSNWNPFIHLYNTKYSTIEDVEFNGNFDILNFNSVDVDRNPIVQDSAGIKITSDSYAINSSNNIVRRCKFYDVFAGIYSDTYTLDSVFTDNEYYLNVYGVALGAGVSVYDDNLPYPSNNTISNSSFDEIYAHGIFAPYAINNLSNNNKFHNVGNRFGGPSSWDSSNTAEFFAAIKYGLSGNNSVDDWFERSYILSTGVSRDGNESTSLTGTVFVPDVQGPVNYVEGFTKEIEVQSTTTAVPLFRLAADDIKTYEIDYVYESTLRTFKRFGKLIITINPTIGSQEAKIIDEYDTVGNDNYDENIQWFTTFPNNGTVILSTENPGDTGTLQFKIHVKS